MDPLSISMACITLGGLIFKVSGVAAPFVRGIQTAEADVNEIIAELESMSAMIKLVTEDFLERIPRDLRNDISDVVASCGKTINEIFGILSYYHPPLGTKTIRWAFSGKRSLEMLKNSLNTHKHDLGLALGIANLITIEDVKDNVIGIKDDTVYMKSTLVDHILIIYSEDPVLLITLQDDVAQILNRVARINKHLSDDGKSLMLRRWLADTSSYAGSILTSGGLDTAVLRQRYEATPESTSSLRRALPSTTRESGCTNISRRYIRESVSDEIKHPDNIRKQWKNGIAMTMTVKTGETAQQARRKVSLRPRSESFVSSHLSSAIPQDQERDLLHSVPTRCEDNDPQESPTRSITSLSNSRRNSRGSFDRRSSPTRYLKKNRLFRWMISKVPRTRQIHSLPTSRSSSYTDSCGSSSYLSCQCSSCIKGEQQKKKGLFSRLIKRHRRQPVESLRSFHSQTERSSVYTV